MLKENLKIALQSVRGQMLRTVITALIIAIGIMALVGILTAIDAIKNSLTGQFSLLGANTFTIQNRGSGIRIGSGGERPKNFRSITYREAQQFKKRMKAPNAVVSVSDRVSSIAKVKYQNQETDPNAGLWGIDENYLFTAGYQLSSGRNLTATEATQGTAIALIGQDIKSDLFPTDDPLGKAIQIKGQRYRVVGVLQSKGSSMGFSSDNNVFIPIANARAWFNTAGTSYAVNVRSPAPEIMDVHTSQSTAIMRAVRRVKPREENNFHIMRSDSLSNSLIENLQSVTIGAVAIALITLLGAAIALMNIMLVSVTERTREIGIRKAIGAKASLIRNQFLTEAITICLLGGIGGILLGIIIGNVTALIIGGSFIIPWLWMLLGVTVCVAVGLLSGFYPAYKASRLNPIDSLRYE